MDPCNIAPYDSSAPSEGAIELLLEQGALSLPMVGVAKGLIAAECASDLLLRTLSGSSASSSGTGRANFRALRSWEYESMVTRKRPACSVATMADPDWLRFGMQMIRLSGALAGRFMTAISRMVYGMTSLKIFGKLSSATRACWDLQVCEGPRTPEMGADICDHSEYSWVLASWGLKLDTLKCRCQDALHAEHQVFSLEANLVINCILEGEPFICS